MSTIPAADLIAVMIGISVMLVAAAISPVIIIVAVALVVGRAPALGPPRLS